MLKTVIPAILITLPQAAFPARLLQFDVAGLVIVRTAAGFINGYYVGRSDESYISKKGDATHVCQFLFSGPLIDAKEAKLSAWEVALSPPQTSRQSRGAIYIKGDEWTIHFRPIPNGCRSKPDGDQFAVRIPAVDDAVPIEEQGLHARHLATSEAIGIRVAKERSSIRATANAASKVIQDAARGDIFVALRSERKYNLVRHIDGETGRVVEGWVEGAALINPFP